MFEDELLSWHDQSRRDLPWCGEKDPYRIWISEIMLQQTRTETVKGYYQRFLQSFPDVQTLAAADEEKLLTALKTMAEGHANELAAAAGIAPFKVRAVLSALEVKGLVTALGGNRYAPV